MSTLTSHSVDNKRCPASEVASRRRHWEVLAVSVFVLIASALLSVRPDDRIVIHGLNRWPLPPTCISKELFGVRCPGCGLTHSFVHIAHGDLTAAWQDHHLGLLLFLVVAAQLPYRIIALRKRGPLRGIWWTTIPKWTAHILIALLLVNWLLYFV